MQDRCCSRLFYSVYEQQQATGVLKKPEEGTVDVAVSVGGGVHVLYKTESLAARGGHVIMFGQWDGS